MFPHLELGCPCALACVVGTEGVVADIRTAVYQGTKLGPGRTELSDLAHD
jgi:hypothetical protein